MENERISLPRQMSKAQRILKRRIWLYLSAIFGVLLFFVLDACGIFVSLGTVEHDGALHSFRLVIPMVIDLYFVVKIIRCRLSLINNSEQILIEESDERRMLVAQKAGKTAITIIAVSMALVAVIIGYINYAAFCVMLGSTIFILAVWGASWFIYNKIY